MDEEKKEVLELEEEIELAEGEEITEETLEELSNGKGEDEDGTEQ